LVLDKIRKGVPVKKAINVHGTFTEGLTEAVGELLFASGAHRSKDDASRGLPGVGEAATLGITQKISSTIFNTNIRIIASAETQPRAREILNDIESAFHQFGNTQGSGVSFSEIKGKKLLRVFQEFSYRTFVDEESFPLNLKELATILHFPVKETHAPGLRQAKAGSAPVPLDLPKGGTLLGINTYHGVATEVYMKKEDRLRHFYTIGQTGTGKTTLLKNMIIQDIARGEGVCMIDPHGTDIVDVLANIPEGRRGDVIYFDPSYTERPMGLNMLEYDTRYPEQKTFVVDELLSIFNKLFDMKVAGGPMFEQYFRNATLLVIDDPESGNTLLDVSRVLSDA
ncbi:MAG: type IV secretion system DNA-binding domain-containing protein, partial [Candidatus Yonathbacteria bacterium]|nr:type IV secretion system DNA-binding domain-containing protein [Candidatus Yonathbacteria bacterium]